MSTPDESYRKFLELKNDLLRYSENDLNETETRCKIIDIIYKDILGWEEDNISREESTNVGYIDYIFSSNTNNFIIEAKRTGLYFNTPTTHKKVKKDGVLSTDKATGNAINQVFNYCKSKHYNVGCISNGYQFICFLINTGNTKHDTYIFYGFDDIERDFTNFYNLFSPYGNIEQKLLELLNVGLENIRDKPQFYRRLLELVFNPDQKLSRNPIDYSISPLINIYFRDLTDEENKDILDECYCSGERTSDYNSQITSIIADQLPTLEIPVQDSILFDGDFRSKERNIRSLYKKSDVMLIVGGVGAGKTTFIYRYFTKILPEEIKKNVIWLWIDFIKQSSDENINLRDYIVKECLRQIREKYRFLRIDTWDELQKIYHSQLIRLCQGALKPYTNNPTILDQKKSDFIMQKISDEVQFGEDVLRYISMKPDKKKTICLTIDNADQMSEDFQKRCILTAYELSLKIKCIILLSMREESFWRLRKIKPLDAYQGHAYHISAPSVSKMLAKRIQVMSKHTGKQEFEIVDTNNIRYKIRLDEFLSIISKSFRHDSNKISHLFEALASNDLRFALEMFRTFLVSGHTNTREYISTYLKDGYLIPYHAFIRSIALGDYKYYHSDRSQIINLLDIDDDGFYSHFNKIRILFYLRNKVNLRGTTGKGFIVIDDMFKQFVEVFNSITSFRRSLTPLLNYRLIEADNGYRISGELANFVRITSSGMYYLNVLLSEFAYMERLCEDTPIKSREVLESLLNDTIEINKNLKSMYSMQLRLNRMKTFVHYLLNEERQEQNYIYNDEIKITILFGSSMKQLLNLLDEISVNTSRKKEYI